MTKHHERKPLTFGGTMVASALGVLIISAIGALLMIIVSVAMVASLANSTKDKPTVVLPQTFLSVDLGQISGDRTPDRLSRSFGESSNVGLIDATVAIRAAATDDNICGLYLRDPSTSSLSWGSLTELRAAIEQFGQSGKPIVSYATAYSQGGYYVASVADKVCLHPAGMVDLRGMGAEVMYYKDMLDKLGIEMQLIRPESCSYKSAGEVYTMNHMSTANREQIRAYIASIWHTATEQIASSRGDLTSADINRLADNLSAYLATDAAKNGIVDSLCFEQDVKDYIKAQYDAKHLVSATKYAININNSFAKTKNRIAVVYAQGNVVDGSARGMSQGVYGDDIVKALRQATNDDNVKAIVLRVNSPGGSATASESMTHAVMQAREKKPVVVSMGDLAASAGYEMSCMADVIVAQPTTITGSIGVFATMPNVGRMMKQKLGLTTDTVKTNLSSTDLTAMRQLSPKARAMMNRNVEDFYHTFVSRVAEGRHMTYDAVHQIARGRVWTGADAVKIGLVDTLGGLDLALAIAAERAGIDSYTVRNYPVEKDIWQQINEMMGSDEERDLNLAAKLRLAWQYRALRQLSPYAPLSIVEQDMLYISQAQGLQARLPFTIVTQ